MKKEKPKAGVPQLWLRGDKGSWASYSLRIIYPDGRVEYFINIFGPPNWQWRKGCTSSDTQLEAIKKCKDYSFHMLRSKPEFICNIE